MNIERAYIGEKLSGILETLVRDFFDPMAEEAGRAREEKGRKPRAIAGTRIMAFSPLLGRNPALQRALDDARGLIEAARNFEEEEVRAPTLRFLNVFRAFLLSLASISEKGVRDNLEMFRDFRRLAHGCARRGAPREENREGSKKSWADFLAASAQPRAEAPSCDEPRASLRERAEALAAEAEGLDEVLRNDADNFLSAAENLQEACKACIHREGAAD